MNDTTHGHIGYELCCSVFHSFHGIRSCVILTWYSSAYFYFFDTKVEGHVTRGNPARSLPTSTGYW